MVTRVQVDGGEWFAAVADVCADPFPPGFDPATVRLPTAPAPRSPQDDGPHHRAYWQAHVWAVLRRYATAYRDPACPPALRAESDRVAADARRLLERATGAFPISPLDSVACHAALKELTAGAVVLERTVAAPRGTAGGQSAEPHATDLPAADLPAVDGPADSDADDGPTVADDEPTPHDDAPPAGVHGQDFFAPAPPRGFEFKLSLRGARGLRRSRELGGARPDPDELPA